MKKNLMIIIAVIFVVAAVISAVFFSGLGNEVKQEFGFEMNIVGSSGNPLSNISQSMLDLNSTLTFSVLAKNPSVINPLNMSKSGWGAWWITNTQITIFPEDIKTGNTTPVINFVQIQNSLGYNVTLKLFENLTGGRITTYSIHKIGDNLTSGFVVAIRNGTNYTLQNSTVMPNNTNETLMGYGKLLNGTTNALIPTGYEIDIFLSSLPNSVSMTNVSTVHSIISDGITQISV